MTRAVEPYLLTRIGPQGPDVRGSLYVLGPPLGPSYADLLRENRRLTGEVEAWRDRCDVENLNRLKAQDRLSRAARVFAVLSHLYPKLRPVIARAREDIWDG